MTFASRSRYLPAATRVGAVAAVAAFAVLAPIRMAQGTPKTRFAVVAAGVTVAAPTDRFAAAAVEPAIPPPPGPVVDSPFPLSHLGVRWVGSESAAVALRLAGSDGVWGPWRAMLADHDLESEGGGPVLSQLILAHGATHAQVRAAGDARDVEILAIDTVHGHRASRVATAAPAGAADSPPADGGEDRSADATSSSSSSSSSSTSSTTKGSGSSSTTTTTVKAKPAVAEPPVVTRAEWGADESIRKNNQKYAPITKLFVHHTVTEADADPAATVRAIYAYHVQGNGWDDIGYNFLVDSQGRVYEGRWARDYATGEKPTGEDLNENGVVGAHVLNHNAGAAGVAMLGDFSNGEPTQAARDTLVKLMAWKADRHNIDVMGNDPFTTSEGVVEYFPNLAGHRDAGQTECPGDRLYPLLPGIRDKVAQFVTAVHGPTTGYWTATADGRVLPFGDVQSSGSMAGRTLSGAIVGMAATPSGKGYWLLGSDGGIFSFGDAKFFGSTGNIKLNKPVVRMAPTPTGKGYWLVATDGGIFSFGDAKFYGSTGDITLNKPVVGMASTQSGKGYWLVASDGGIFAYGDATFAGSTGSLKLNKPVVSMAPAPNGKGYWLVASDGGLFAFDVPFFGSVAGARPVNYPGAVQMRATTSGKGYYVADANGGIAVFGDASFLGADTSQRGPKAAVDLVLGS
ncbi:MAG TPA: peptidoglycan recognition family protein [Acidimicrobiia bacterium]|nr:peptidoglycan recognition family protein [Acidimicrobiia bacterium]